MHRAEKVVDMRVIERYWACRRDLRYLHLNRLLCLSGRLPTLRRIESRRLSALRRVESGRLSALRRIESGRLSGHTGLLGAIGKLIVCQGYTPELNEKK